MPGGGQLQDCPGGSTVIDLIFPLCPSSVLAFDPHACPMWSYSHFHMQGMKKEEGAALACLKCKSFWGEGEGTKKHSSCPGQCNSVRWNVIL